MSLERIIRKLDNAINIDEEAIIKGILDNPGFQRFIIDLNTTGQLFEQGINALNVSLGDYAPSTIEGTSNFRGKIDKGQRVDHITLKDTGAFYETFKLITGKNGFTISANPQKEDSNLFDDFGKDIVGLTDENLQKVIDAIREKIIPVIRLKLAA